MQSPYIAAALSHASAQDIERSLRRPDRLARHELEIELGQRSRRADRPSAWSRFAARLIAVSRPRHTSATRSH